MNPKSLGLFWLFRPSTNLKRYKYLGYTTTSITLKHVVDKLEQSWATVYKKYCKNRGQKKSSRKKTQWGKNMAGNLRGIHGSCSEKPIKAAQLERLCSHLLSMYTNKAR